MPFTAASGIFLSFRDAYLAFYSLHRLQSRPSFSAAIYCSIGKMTVIGAKVE